MVCTDRQRVSQFNDKLSCVHKPDCKPIYRRKKKQVSVLIVKIFDLSVENADLGHNFSLYRPSSGARKQDIFILKKIGYLTMGRNRLICKEAKEKIDLA